jgi:hypothetical protein
MEMLKNPPIPMYFQIRTSKPLRPAVKKFVLQRLQEPSSDKARMRKLKR